MIFPSSVNGLKTEILRRVDSLIGAHATRGAASFFWSPYRPFYMVISRINEFKNFGIFN